MVACQHQQQDMQVCTPLEGNENILNNHAIDNKNKEGQRSTDTNTVRIRMS